jgi:hypothetical protein
VEVCSFREVNSAKDDAWRAAFELDISEFSNRTFFNPVTQSQELMLAMSRQRSAGSFQMIHGIRANRTRYLRSVIQHRKQDDHSIEVVGLKLPLRENHSRNSIGQTREKRSLIAR